jgi:hypothetical protein
VRINLVAAGPCESAARDREIADLRGRIVAEFKAGGHEPHSVLPRYAGAAVINVSCEHCMALRLGWLRDLDIGQPWLLVLGKPIGACPHDVTWTQFRPLLDQA